MPDTAKQPNDVRQRADAGQSDEKPPAEGSKADETVEFMSDLIESKDADCGRG